MNRSEYLNLCAEEAQSFLTNNKVVLEYVRGRQNRKVGVVLAYQAESGEVCIGYSKCKTRSNGRNVDVFNKSLGIVLALKRAEELPPSEQNVPQSVQKTFDHVMERSIAYFKGGVFV